MIDDAVLESLPADPEEAFYVFEQYMRQKLIKLPEFFDHHDAQRDFEVAREANSREYFTAISAFLDSYGFELSIDFEELFSSYGNEFWNLHKIALQKIQFFSMQCAFRRNQKKKAGSTCIYILEPSAKIKIQKYVSKIKETILEADLTDWKREALASRLNAFSLEVDKDRTRLEALASLYVLAKKEVKEIKPIAEQIEKIWDTVSKSSEELWKALPKPKVNGYLEKPQAKIEHQNETRESFDLDDEIPF